jgi:hypothetical protein
VASLSSPKEPTSTVMNLWFTSVTASRPTLVISVRVPTCSRDFVGGVPSVHPMPFGNCHVSQKSSAVFQSVQLWVPACVSVTFPCSFTYLHNYYSHGTSRNREWIRSDIYKSTTSYHTSSLPARREVASWRLPTQIKSWMRLAGRLRSPTHDTFRPTAYAANVARAGRLWSLTWDIALEYTKQESNVKHPYCVLVSCLAYSWTLKTEATYFSETPVDSQQSTRRYIPKRRTLHNQRFDSLKSYLQWYVYEIEYRSFVPDSNFDVRNIQPIKQMGGDECCYLMSRALWRMQISYIKLWFSVATTELICESLHGSEKAHIMDLHFGITVSLNDRERGKVTTDTRVRGIGLLRFNGCRRKCAHASFVAGGLGRRKNSMRWKEQRIQKEDEGKK